MASFALGLVFSYNRACFSVNQSNPSQCLGISSFRQNHDLVHHLFKQELNYFC
jgi:hypothetical protein